MIFCTLSDKNYVLNGLALAHSLGQFYKKFTLYYLCLDDETYKIVSKKPNIKAIKLSQLPRKDIETAKANPPCNYGNQYSQFCWTMTPYFIWYLLKTTKELMYVDSDIYFYHSPELIRKQCKGYSMGIHTHRFTKDEKKLGDDTGEFNVGVVYFNGGKKIAKFWKDLMLNPQNEYREVYGKCGDQSYLNIIKKLHSKEIKVFDRNLGHTAPWCHDVQEYLPEHYVRYKKRKLPLVFVHFARFQADLINNKWQCAYGKYIMNDSMQFQHKWQIQVYRYYNQYFKTMKMLQEEKKIRICFAMIVHNSDYVLKQVLDSIYPYAVQIVINNAPVEYFKDKEKDNTAKILKEYPDPENKLTIISIAGKDKTDLCKAYMPYIKNVDYLWAIDADEIYKPEHIEKIIDILKKRSPEVVGFLMQTFVGGFQHVLTGYERNFNVRRIFKYKPGCEYVEHRPPKLSTENIPNPTVISGKEMFDKYGVEFFHYSYVFPKQVYDKVQYYDDYVIPKGNCIPNFFRAVWLKWVLNPDKRTEIARQYQGIHESEPKIRGDCYPALFMGEHPEVIKDAMPDLVERFDRELEHFKSAASIEKDICWQKKNCSYLINKYLYDTKDEPMPYHFKIFSQLLPWMELRGEKILDLGCGGAQLSEMCEDFIYEGADLPNIIEECAKVNYPKHKYFSVDIESGLEVIKKYDLVVASALIDIMKEPEKILNKILSQTKKYFILHRQEITEGETRIDVNESYGGLTYHSVINRNDFLNILKKNGFKIVKELNLDYAWESGGTSFLLQRK